jgi:hypothetical protein
VPAATPLPDTSTRTTSKVSPDLLVTTKSPENESPYADSTDSSAPHSGGSSGSSPWVRSRSRRSTSIDSPSVPWTPSLAREAATQNITTMIVTSTT